MGVTGCFIPALVLVLRKMSLKGIDKATKCVPTEHFEL